MQEALTDQGYWDSVWTYTDDHSSLPTPRVGAGFLERFLWRAVASRLAPGRRFIEIGAGGSPWPAHVASRLGAEGWGIDFSRPGLEMAARAIGKGSARVVLVEGDLFDRTKLPAGAFDIVYSGGFVEHFPSPRPVMERFAELLAPGGVVVTAVPNMCGVNGLLQKWADRETYDRHVVISPDALDSAHATGGLVPIEPARWLGVVDFGCVNYSHFFERIPSLAARAMMLVMAKTRLAGGWWEERSGGDGGRMLAPMVAGIYGKR
jgi:SAM-dependent methyltransferase